jgi:ketosteroid isomerase-like protein
MSRLLSVFAVGALGLGLVGGRAPLVAAADAMDDVKTADTAVYQAIATRDSARLGTLLADDFVLTNTFGEVYDRERFLAACCTGESPSKTLLLGATELQVKIYGNAAVVAARTEMRFTRDNDEQKLAWRSTRTYVKTGGRWKLVAEQRTAIG